VCYLENVNNYLPTEDQMIRSSTKYQIVTLIVAVAIPLLLAPPAFAASADVTQVDNFIRNVIKVIAGLAGLVATGFFVIGGFSYITSSGNPEHLDKAKRTLLWSSIGLAIVIAAFVLSNIVATIATDAFGS
jgi:hypothetical protein